MIRRNFLKGFSLLGLAGLAPSETQAGKYFDLTEKDDRAYWVDMLSQIVSPVLENLSQNQLRKKMPVESVAGAQEGRKKVTYLEAFGRSLAGIAPWLELGADDSREGKIRAKFIDLSTLALKNAVTPSSADYMNFTEGGQPLVDAAFLAHALIRAPEQLWGNLDKTTQAHLITALRSTRVIKPYYSNWLLFTAMVEAALLKFSNEYDAVRVDYAIRQHESWYKGDGIYGDGPEFHFDHYNSFVIHPMLLDIVTAVNAATGEYKELLEKVVARSRRYAAIQERLISPEGAFPPVGRSIAYRCGAFQHLAQMALQKQLPSQLAAAQVRGALTAVIRRSMEAAGTFDK